ncbi:MAG: hydroxymethylbilane synthase, partial [Planctomycetota bacterium]
RVSKVVDGEIEAAILARAGLVRLGLEDHIAEVLDANTFLPAVGQGIVGLTCREEDRATIERVSLLARDPDAWASAMAERAFLRAMKGGCNAPVGGHASIDGGTLRLAGRVLSVDGSRTVDGSVEGDVGRAEHLGNELADDMAARGGAELIEEARASLA